MHETDSDILSLSLSLSVSLAERPLSPRPKLPKFVPLALYYLTTVLLCRQLRSSRYQGMYIEG